jgi:hypothetical protein
MSHLPGVLQRSKCGCDEISHWDAPAIDQAL